MNNYQQCGHCHGWIDIESISHYAVIVGEEIQTYLHADGRCYDLYEPRGTDVIERYVYFVKKKRKNLA